MHILSGVTQTRNFEAPSPINLFFFSILLTSRAFNVKPEGHVSLMNGGVALSAFRQGCELVTSGMPFCY